MTRAFRAPALVFLALPLFAASPAYAQDTAAAEALFNKGVAEMQAGHFDVACPAVAESQRLDPRPGTLFTLAECEAKAGKIATALVHYDDYLHLVGTLPEAQKKRHAERVDIAKGQQKALAPEVPTLTLTLPKDAPADLRVLRDGTEMASVSLGVALPIDPGEHLIVTTVGTGPKHEQRITIEKREKKTLAVEWTRGPGAGTGSPDPGKATQNTGTSGHRIGMYVAGGVGIAGLVLGGVTGGLALGEKSTVDANCPNRVCNDAGTKALESGRTMGLVSTVGLAVGAAGVVGAVILWLTEPIANKAAPNKAAPNKAAPAVGVSFDIGPSGGMLRLKGDM